MVYDKNKLHIVYSGKVCCSSVIWDEHNKMK